MNDRAEANLDFDELLHPADAFGSPTEVVNDPDLTLNAKRAILASWASDACAIEAAPELRARPHGRPIRFDDIIEALRALDQQANGDKYGREPRRNRIPSARQRDDATSSGVELHNENPVKQNGLSSICAAM